jgi:tetratricopeptide (TPR) repeat protein
MVLELVAGRLTARYLGSSLYTWTSVIGVVLAGITVGNYLGGRIADRFPPKKALAALLGISSFACVVIIILNNLVGSWIWLWKLGWSAHVFTHVFLTFMLPSTLLGTISPVVAKMALDRGLPTGRTVGDIYAFGAAGSIVGTFLAGFYLIAVMGTIAIIWTVGAALLLMAVLYRTGLKALYLWAVIFCTLLTMAMSPFHLAQEIGVEFALREKPDPEILYEDESQYCYIAIRRSSETVDKREFIQDKLKHSEIIMDDILDLQYPYERIFAAVTQMLSQGRDKISILAIGGGGYVFPRYVEKVWPGSHIDVVEIDPRVTEAAILAFGLERNTTINTFTMDARNYIDQFLGQKRSKRQKTQYDFIYGDAFNDYSVPYQLTTREFNDKIARILTDRGVYMINLMDTYDSGLFVGAIINTLEKTFPCVYVVAKEHPRSLRNTFVILAATQKINLENLTSGKPVEDLGLWILNDSEIETLREKGRRVVLTDDYAPVENMLAPVVRQSALYSLSNRYLEIAIELKNQGKLDESLAMYKEVIKADPTRSVSIYNDIGQILVTQGKWQQAIDAAKNAIEYNEKAEVKQNMSDMYYNIGLTLKKLDRNDEASEYIRKAIEGYQKDLAKKPASINILRNLCNALLGVNRFDEATKYLQQAVDTNPSEVMNHLMLADVFLKQQRYDEAAAVVKKATPLFSDARNVNATVELQKYLWLIEDSKKANKK